MTAEKPSESEDLAAFLAALDYLREFTDYEQLIQQTPARRSFDLGRLRRLLADLGHPEGHGVKVHVTGTKGKSSVVSMTDALLRSQGLRCFRFISPHLETVRERLSVDDAAVPSLRFASLVDRLRPQVEARRNRPEELPSFFECMTVMGFLLAKEEEVDASVIEVGLGGRLDATNVIDPAVSLITPIGLDHTRVLGPNRRAIAGEKAGIIKPGRPVVTSITPEDETFPVIEERAAELSAPLFCRGRDLFLDACEAGRAEDGGPALRFRGRIRGEDTGEFTLRAGAEHQAWNALIALAGASIATEACGRIFDFERARDGLRNLRLPGRAEWFPGNPALLLDGAHTTESATDLAQVVARIAGGRPVHLLAGLTRDRDPTAIFPDLATVCDSATATGIPSPRSLDPELLAAALGELGLPCRAVADPKDALAAAREVAGQDGIVCVAGSLYLAGSVRTALRREGSRASDSPGSDEDEAPGTIPS